MAPAALFTLFVTLLLFGLLLFTRYPADLIFAGGLTLLMVFGVLTPDQAFAGLVNEGVLTIAVLYLVVAGLQETGALYWLPQRLLGRPRSTAEAQLRLMAPVAASSAFLNNTPVVAMLVPVVRDWAKRHGLAPSKLLLPLSYAAILGGTCTLIGTSTNLVVAGLLLEHGYRGMGLFEPAWVGLPVAVAGIAFVLLAGRRLLPDRRASITQLDDPREYSVEMMVAPGGPLVGKSIEEAGLRHLGSVYLMEIDRDGQILPAVSPRERLHGGDRLVFVGVVDSVVDLQRIPGLLPATDQLFSLDQPRSHRLLIEAVVSPSCPLVGATIRDGAFRSRYGAVVIAVARHGRRLAQKLGDVVLQAGDTLLLEAGPAFLERQRNARDFYLVSPIDGAHPPRFERALLAGGILAGMVLSVAAGWLGMLEAALLAAGLMILGRCLRPATARRSVDWSVLVVIVAAFGIGRALELTQVTNVVAEGLVGLAGASPLRNLLAVYLVTVLFSNLLTNNAAAVLMFPLGVAVAETLGVSVLPFAVAIMIAASASFATPIGYQTNLMVYGPGGYRFGDYLRLGLPLTIVTGAVALAIIPLVWRF